MVNPDINYYNRFDKSKNYARTMFLAGRVIQAAEFNEMQDEAEYQRKKLADTLYRDGDIIGGGIINVTGNTATVTEGTAYAKGVVWDIPAAEFSVPDEGTVVIGIRIREQIVTELQDGTLRDPSAGCANYGQPGAHRLKKWAEWSFATDVASGDDFYSSYPVIDKIVQYPPVITDSTGLNEALARYDYDSNGNYVVEGLQIRAISVTDGLQIFTCGDGRAHVVGREINKPTMTRIEVPESADSAEITDEWHLYNPVNGKMRVNVRHTPIEQIRSVGITIERTFTMTHGGFSGAVDPLPNTSVIDIIEVKQGGTTYQKGTDYRLTGDSVDWTPSGAEPAPMSTYTVRFHYRGTAEPTDSDAIGFSVTGAVDGTPVLVDYKYRLPRKDVFVLNRDGEITQVRGVSHSTAAVPPETPSGTLRLAIVHQNWDGVPIVENDAVMAIPISQIESMRRSIRGLYDLNALQMLQTDALITAPSATHGVFVDPFIDDDMRDQGIEQSAAIVLGMLMLPIEQISDVQQPGNENTLLAYTHEVILRQEARSGKMKINPYHAFDPVPARVVLNPSVDRWSELNLSWASAVTERFVVRWSSLGWSERVLSTSQRTETISARTTNIQIMRQRSVSISAAGFGPNEPFTLRFAGIVIPASPNKADSNGNVNSAFTVPPNIPTGSVDVEITGSGGSGGKAVYTSSGTITSEVRRVVTVINTERYDPLAQTFTLDETRYVTGAELRFETKGTSSVRVQIRDTLLGQPADRVLAEGEIQPSAIIQGGATRVLFSQPVRLDAGTDYALVVLTDTADHELAIAELGQWDLASNSWIRRQTYQTGMLCSSSNARGWTLHQSADMWFRLLGAKFTSLTKTEAIDTNLSGSDATDVLVLAEVEFPSNDTETTFVLKKSDGTEVARLQAGQSLALTSELQGVFSLSANLSGSSKFSPVLYNGAQLILGKVAPTADYISRAFPCGTSKKVSVRLDVFTPGSSTVRVYVQTGAEAWTEAVLGTQNEVGDGWKTRTYSADCSAQTTRVKILLNGTSAERPTARNLRAVILDA